MNAFYALMLFLSLGASVALAEIGAVAPVDGQTSESISAPEAEQTSEQLLSKAATDEGDSLTIALNSFYLGTVSVEELIEEVLASKYIDKLDEELLMKIESVLLEFTKPIPASDIEGNLNGYSGLSFLRPENIEYSSKRDAYRDKIKEKRESIVKTLKKTEDEFSSVIWYMHPSYPKYTDARNYIQVYIGVKGDLAWLRMRLNYTNNSWLFITSATAKIDGDFVDMSYTEFLRDNDSEILEWIDVEVTSEIRTTLQRIANSSSTIIRFVGQQYHDDFEVGAKDKQAMKDMFLALDVLMSK